MNANNQNPTSLFSTIGATLAKWRNSSYAMMMSGFKSSMPMPGATGIIFKSSRKQQNDTDKSKRVMRFERGGQPEAIGDRRFIRYANRALKRKNSFGNNAVKLARS